MPSLENWDGGLKIFYGVCVHVYSKVSVSTYIANNLNGFNSAIYMHNYFVYKYIAVSGDDNK